MKLESQHPEIKLETKTKKVNKIHVDAIGSPPPARKLSEEAAIPRMVSPTFESIFKVVLTLILLTSCGILMYFQKIKFINTHTTIATRVDSNHDKLDMPSMGFCPGLKFDKISELVWPVRVFDSSLYSVNDTFDDTFPTTREGIDALWDEYTYSADEFIVEIGAEYQNIDFTKGNGNDRYMPKDLLNKQVGCLSLKEYGTPLGKCYSIDTFCKVIAEDALVVTFNLTMLNKKRITLGLRPMKAYMGNTGYDPGIPTFIRNFESGSHSSIKLYTKHKTDTKGSGTVSEDDYYDCVTKAVHDKARAVSGKLCYHPSFAIITGPELLEELEPCASERTFFMANFALMEAMMLPVVEDHGCAKSKSLTTYDLFCNEFLSGVHLKDDFGTVFVALRNTDIILEEDYNLQDFYAIVATLGGSIGIFFGWSFYDLTKIISAITKARKQRKE